MNIFLLRRTKQYVVCDKDKLHAWNNTVLIIVSDLYGRKPALRIQLKHFFLPNRTEVDWQINVASPKSRRTSLTSQWSRAFPQCGDEVLQAVTNLSK